MNILFKITVYSGVALIAFMGLLTLSDVTGRYIFNSPIRGTVEIITSLLFAIAGLAVAAAMFKDEHVKVEMVFDKLSLRWQRILRIFADILGFIAFAAITWQNAIVSWESFIELEPMSTAFLVPIYPFRIVGTLGFAITAVVFIYHLIEVCRSQKQYIEMPQEKPEEEAFVE